MSRAVKDDAAVGDREACRRQQPHQRAAGDGLARPALADQPQDLAAPERERDPVDNDRAGAVAHRFDAEVAYREQLRAHSLHTQKLAQAVGQHAEAEGEHHDGEAGEGGDPPGRGDEVLAFGDHDAPFGVGGCTPRPR